MSLTYAGRRTRQIHNRICKRSLSQRRCKSGNSDTSQSERSSTFLIGSIAGTCGSLAGMGGGFIMIPLMTARLGLTQHQAHATSLFAVATTGLAGALSYSSLGESNNSENVDAKVAAAVALSGMATASLGAHASARLSQKLLKRTLGIFMLLVAPTIPMRDYLVTTKETKESTTESEDSKWWHRYIKASGIGCFSGFLAGMFGVGGGAVVVPALSLLWT